MARGRKRLLTHWKTVFSDSVSGFRRSIQHGASNFSEGIAKLGRSILHAPEEFVRGLKRAASALSNGVGNFFRSVKETPDEIRRTRDSVGKFVKTSGQQAAKSVKAARIQIKEQPEELQKGIAGSYRNFKTWLASRPLWVKGLLALLAVSVASTPFTAKPAYHALTNWRAERLIASAEQLDKQGNSEAAFQKASAAYLLNRFNRQVILTTAELAHKVSDKKSLEFALQAATLPDAPATAMETYVEEALGAGQPARARPFLNHLRQSDPKDANVIALEIRYWMATGDNDHALAVAKEALKQKSDDPEINKLFAELTLQAHDPSVVKEGLQQLKSLAEGNDATARLALESLLRYPNLSDQEKLHYASLLAKNPQADRSDQLLATQIRLAEKATSIEQIEPNIKNWFDFNSIEDMRALGKWLSDNQLYAELLKLIPKSTAVTDKTIFRYYLFALVSGGQPDQALNLLNSSETLPVTQVERLIYEAGVQKTLGKDQAFETTVGLAIAKSEPQDFSFLDGSIRFFQNPDLLIEFYRRVGRDPRFALFARAHLLALGYTFHRNDVIDEILPSVTFDDLADFPDALNTLAYLKLLKRQDVEQARQAAESLVAKNPANFSYRVTLALAYFLSKKPQAASATLSTQIDKPDHLEPGWKIVISAVMEATGQKDASQLMVESIDPTALLPAEKTFLHTLKAQKG